MNDVKLNVNRPLVFVSAGTFTAAERWIHQKRVIIFRRMICYTIYWQAGYLRLELLRATNQVF